jgi:fructose-1,6-bisphosphatase I
MPSTSHVALADFLAARADRFPAGVAEILEVFAATSVALRDSLAVAPLTGLLGATGDTNVQDESTARLDEHANQLFREALRLPSVARLISEEEAEAIEIGDGPYTCCFDPLDGSSNIGVASVGSVLGIYEGVSAQAFGPEGTGVTGRQLRAAAFVVYGLPTVMILATPGAVDGFAFDPADCTWRLAFPGIRAPRATYTSINWTYRDRWSDRVARAVDHASDGLRGRYSGSMVEDILRVLFAGGVFLYPEDSAAPAGKLRMLYEICPIGLILEAAGGAASTGTQSVLDVPVTSIHQRGAMITGDRDAVERYQAAYTA